MIMVMMSVDWSYRSLTTPEASQVCLLLGLLFAILAINARLSHLNAPLYPDNGLSSVNRAGYSHYALLGMPKFLSVFAVMLHPLEVFEATHIALV